MWSFVVWTQGRRLRGMGPEWRDVKDRARWNGCHHWCWQRRRRIERGESRRGGAWREGQLRDLRGRIEEQGLWRRERDEDVGHDLELERISSDALVSTQELKAIMASLCRRNSHHSAATSPHRQRPSARSYASSPRPRRAQLEARRQRRVPDSRRRSWQPGPQASWMQGSEDIGGFWAPMESRSRR